MKIEIINFRIDETLDQLGCWIKSHDVSTITEIDIKYIKMLNNRVIRLRKLRKKCK
jgi:hypothetical protein